MNPWLIIGGLVGAIGLTATTSFIAYGKGKEAERLVWQTANVETLVGANEGLSEYVDELETKASNREGNEIDVSQDIGSKTHTVETRIIQVPVEKVVTVQVPADCDANDINISYDTLSLFNSWSKGGRLSETATDATTRDVPLVGTEKVSRNIAGDWP